MTDLANIFSAHGPLPTAHSFALAALLTPGFAIAGGLLVAIPIIIHILNRRRFKIQQWAAMKFLLEAMKRNRRRLKFEEWLLLAARCALLGLLGLALARPLGCDNSTVAALAGQKLGLHVIVVDNSYSMAYEAPREGTKTHLERAKKIAAAIVGQLEGGGESVAVIVAGRPAKAVVARPSYDLPAAVTAIERIEQTYAATDLVGALKLAQEIGSQAANLPTRTLHILTDDTASAFRGEQNQPLATLVPDLAKTFRIALHDLGRPGQWNQVIDRLDPQGGLVRQGFVNTFVAAARGYGGERDAGVIWRLEGQPLAGNESVRPDAAGKPVAQSDAQFTRGGLQVMSAELTSPSDPLPADNTRHRVIDVASELKILLVEGQSGGGRLNGSASFLRLALSPPSDAEGTNRRSASYVVTETISPLELRSRAVAEYRAVMLADVGSIDDDRAEQLAAYVKQGGTVIWFVCDAVQTANYNNVLLPRKLIPGKLGVRVNAPEGKPAFFAFNPEGQLHPMLQAFKTVANSGLGTAKISTYLKVEPSPEINPDRVLDYQPTEPGRPGDPAILMHALGEGRVVFVTTTANPDWNSLQAKPAFVALVHEMVRDAVNAGERWLNLNVGDSVEVPVGLALTTVPQLVDAQGRPTTLERYTREDGSTTYRSTPVMKPGLYQLETGNGRLPVAVNVPPGEADVTHLDENAVRTLLGNDSSVAFFGDQLPGGPEAVAARADDGRDYGWTILLAVLGLLGFECFMAMRFGHYRR
jgi:hypothetical protein